MNKQHTFTSDRLGFRDWTASDIPKMAEINADPKVMEHFPSIPNYRQTEEFIQRMKQMYAEKGFCYFAVDKLDNNEFIGFIGICEQTFESEFTPCIDIGWRLSQSEWGKGYATEGAKRCLDYAFNELGLERILSICPTVNDKSERVMIKLEMQKIATFNHPLLKEHKHLEKCVAYEIRNN
ncbi:GNAT family N-acetyltransferase [Aureibacter tunicatorum]|uniref:RimJ/RimL family protein N-acetyltransferase n=1 Tax=Aureibacter tunicatorum TaxID=866807 RepID=A0AAE4BUV3_9BACT|nr:GNAT family N-acetyltransferase [Aureibacter tunicatorum]MDR6241153.1 RimJ/RimL family protein N-acetyltransferase [Aureibacter tunicatorum]BDD03930.1 N-acetyltransferase [Aureibacter tunicatorum]